MANIISCKTIGLRQGWTSFYSLFLVALFYFNAYGRIGESFEECVTRYGNSFWAMPYPPVVFPDKIRVEPFLNAFSPKGEPVVTGYFTRVEYSKEEFEDPSSKFSGFKCVRIIFCYDNDISNELASSIIEKNLPGLKITQESALGTYWGKKGDFSASLIAKRNLIITHRDYFTKLKEYFNDKKRFKKAKARL